MENLTYVQDGTPYPEKVERFNTSVAQSHFYTADLPYKHYAWQDKWQKIRPLKLHRVAGEFFGVFVYCYAGMGAQAALFLSQATNQPAYGSLFTVGAAYAAGIAFALATGGSSSGAHFSPSFSIAMATWRDIKWSTVPPFIVVQILGAFVAGLVVYCQYRPYLLEIEAGMKLAGEGAAIIGANGPAGIFAFYPTEGISLRWVFANEFFADFFVGLVLWGTIDYTNVFVTPTTVPLFVGLAFGVSIWGFAPATVVLNPARDIGGRLVAIAIWGTGASGGKYAALSALTSIPATMLATTLYQIFLYDYNRAITSNSRELELMKTLHYSHRERMLAGSELPASRDMSSQGSGLSSDASRLKADVV